METVVSLVHYNPSKTIFERVIVYQPVTELIGLMQLIEKGKETSKKAKVRRYCVTFYTFLPGGDVQFKITKPMKGGKAGDDKQYFCKLVGAHLRPANNQSRWDECGCKGYIKDGTCAHLSALRALAAGGYLHGFSPPQPAPVATGQ